MLVKRRAYLLLFGMVGLLCEGAFGQGATGEITGVVRDTTNSVVPGADVHLRNPETGAARHAISNDAGVYTFPLLRPGTYTVAAEMPGFQRQERRDVLVQIQQVVRVDFILTIGEISETVEVTAGGSALLSVSDVTLGQVIETRQMIELPLNTRNYLHLTALAPGVNINSSPGGATSFQGGHRSRQSITVSGQRNSFNHYTLDGIENTDPNFNTYVFLPSLDALHEFKVQRATYPAEFGFAAAQVNVTTKTGTNQFHGSLFEYVRNEKLDAKNYFDDPNQPIPPYKRNQFGGTIGGPILRDKLFFFGNFEGLREVKTLTAIRNVPTLAQRQGDLSGMRPIYDPATRRFNESGVLVADPFLGNQIPADRMDPIALLAMDQFWPKPNLPGRVRNYLNNDPLRTTNDQYMVRIDFQQSENASWFGRFSFADDSEYNPGNFPDQGTVTDTRADQAMISHTRIVNRDFVSESRFGWTRFDNKVIGKNSYLNDINGDILKIGGINLENNPAFFGIPVFNVSGFTSFGDRNHIYLTYNNIYEFHQNFSWLRGNHYFKFGATMNPIHYNQYGNQFVVGDIGFTGHATRNPGFTATTGEGLADFLLGLPYQPTVPVKAADANMRSIYWAGYLTDSWKVTPRLTVDLGIRYEYLQPFKDINDMAVNLWDPYGPNPILVRASNQGLGRDPYEDQLLRFTRAEIVRDGRMGAGLVKPDRNNWAPRVGLAYHWRPSTVIRAGGGVFYTVLDMGNSIYDMARTLGGLRRDFSDDNFPDLTLANPFRTYSEGNLIQVAQPLILANAYDTRSSYTTQWTVDVQQSIGRDLVVNVAYVGSQSHKLKKFVALNIPGPGPGSVDPRRPHQQFGYIQYPNTIGNANYNALQVKVERRMAAGFTLLSGYTYSKSIDDGSGVRVGAGENFMSNNHTSINAGERARSTFDVRHRWVTSSLYELPFGRGSANPISWIYRDWQMGGIFTLETGMPSSPGQPTTIANAGGFSGYRPDLVPGQDPNTGPRTVEKWFNTDAFAYSAPYTYGNAGRNIIQGPPIVNLDASLARRFRFGEGSFLEFKTEVFNLANHPIFAFPNTSLNSPLYGQITSTRVDSRQIQLGLRLVF